MDRMHESKQYGYLSANGKPMTDEQIARMCGTTLQEYVTLLAELDALGIPRRTASGIIFCKRMVEDEKKRALWRKRQYKHRDTARDVTALSRRCHADLHSSSSKIKTTPLPPAHAGEIQFIEWHGNLIEVQAGRRKRLPRLDHFHGLHGKYVDQVLSFLNSRGFQSRIATQQ